MMPIGENAAMERGEEMLPGTDLEDLWEEHRLLKEMQQANSDQRARLRAERRAEDAYLKPVKQPNCWRKLRRFLHISFSIDCEIGERRLEEEAREQRRCLEDSDNLHRSQRLVVEEAQLSDRFRTAARENKQHITGLQQRVTGAESQAQAAQAQAQAALRRLELSRPNQPGGGSGGGVSAGGSSGSGGGSSSGCSSSSFNTDGGTPMPIPLPGL
eukprot:gene5392-5614_t